MAGEPKTIENGHIDWSVADSPERTFDAIMRFYEMRFESCLPAIVKDYNRNTHLALVQPLVNMVSSKGEQMPRADIIVPVRRVMYGEFMIDFPLNIGDTGWVIAGDRDSENALIANSSDVTSESNPNEGGQRPATRLLHKYRFGFFIPDRWGTINLATKTGDPNYMDGQNVDGQGVDYKDLAVIRSQNGKTMICLSKDGDVEITLNRQGANSNLTINSNVTVCGKATFKPSAESDESVVVDSGGITATKTITASEDIVAQGVSVATHYHKDSWGQDTTMPTS